MTPYPAPAQCASAERCTLGRLHRARVSLRRAWVIVHTTRHLSRMLRSAENIQLRKASAVGAMMQDCWGLTPSGCSLPL